MTNHRIEAVRPNGARITADIVGPVCESGDFLGLHRDVDDTLPGDLVAVLSAGAYGFVMASNYNSRGMAAEVLVSGNKAAMVRERQPLASIWAAEKIPAWLK